MLKVVGASLQKTRIGTYILIGAGLLVIGAFFIVYIERPTYDGTYCATAIWTKQVGFQVEYWKQQNDLLNIPKGAARICYKDSIFENGWAQIEVETQRSYPDWVQAYAAGMLEGSLTWNNIYNQWQNTIQVSCERDENSQNFCNWLREVLEENYKRIKLLALQRGENDHYWHQISLYFNQLEGLETGYIRGATRARSDLEEEIPFVDFLLLNAAADMQDLKIYYENYILSKESELPITTQDENQNPKLLNKNFNLPNAIMLTKIFQTDNSPTWKLLFGHSTAGSYASMLRIQKRYKFHYHFSPNQRTNTVPGVDITFTGYPGILGSTDDFYIVKGRQVQSIVAGVLIKNDNLQLWQHVNINESIPMAARVMAANRIAQNRRTWAKAIAKHPATGCKQWITVDLNKLSPQGNLYATLSEDEKHDDAALTLNAADEAAINERHNRYKGLVWIVEQLPGRVFSKDVSEQFVGSNGSNGCWLARGIPFLNDTINASGLTTELYDDSNTQFNNIDHSEINNLEAVDHYLRTQGFRGDLLGPDESVAYGNIDIKLFSYNAKIGMSDYHAFAGPIFMQLSHMKPRAIPSTTDKILNNDSNEIVAASLKDESLNVEIDNAGAMGEIELISERRSIRNDMRAIAMRRDSDSTPFKWSSATFADIEHNGHPDVWNFECISPAWTW